MLNAICRLLEGLLTLLSLERCDGGNDTKRDYEMAVCEKTCIQEQTIQRKFDIKRQKSRLQSVVMEFPTQMFSFEGLREKKNNLRNECEKQTRGHTHSKETDKNAQTQANIETNTNMNQTLENKRTQRNTDGKTKTKIKT